MKPTYREVRHSEDSHFLTLLAETTNKEITYRGNSPKGRIKPGFPWLKYTKQLFIKSDTRILNPTTFWYNHKREFIADCWYLADIDKLDRAWNLTIQLEMLKTLKSQPKVKLKYRGVTYYK